VEFTVIAHGTILYVPGEYFLLHYTAEGHGISCTPCHSVVIWKLTFYVIFVD